MIIVKRNPLGVTERLDVAPNARVIDYLHAYDHETELDVEVFVNNERIEKDSDFGRYLSESDILTFAYRPAGVELAYIAVGIVVTALLVKALTPDPEIPNAVGTTSTSPNNSVSGQTNTVRKYEGAPNIYGRVISYPDLLANSIPEWVSNRKQVRELFLIGEGEYQINGIRDGKTPISDLPNSSATVYGPGTYPDDLYRINFSDEVDNQELLATDDPSITWSGAVQFGGTGVSFTDSGTASGSTIEFSDVVPVPDVSTIPASALYVGDVITVSGGSNGGTYTVTGVAVSIVDNGGVDYTITVTVTVNSTLNSETATYTIATTAAKFVSAVNNSTIATDLGLVVGGTFYVTASTSNNREFTIASIATYSGNTVIYVDEATTRENDSSATISTVSGGAYVGWFTMPTTAEQIWANLTCPRGIISESGGSISIVCGVEIQQIDSLGADVGSPIVQQVTFSGKTYETQGKTIKFTGLGGNRYKIRANRITTKYAGSATDYVEFNEAYTVNEYSGANFGDVTIIDVLTKSRNSGNSSSRKINVDVTRKLNGVATTNFADAVVDLIVNKGGRPITDIDTDSLYEIADGLSADLREFSFTFDDKNISLGQAVLTACNVARVKPYREGQIWRFTRDEAKPRTYLFNRRNLAAGENQSQSFKGRQPNDYDSIRLRYYDRDIEDYDDVLINITGGDFAVGSAGANPKELELAGCANYAQALNRANLEARKLVYQRWSVEDVALSDAANVSIGDRVAWADIYDGEIFEGEIRGQSGNTFYTSEPVTIADDSTYYALITAADGSVQGPVQVTAVAGNENAFTASGVSVGLADGFSVQAGSKYLIGTNDDLELYDFTVTELGEYGQDGRISIKLIQYSDNVYEAD